MKKLILAFLLAPIVSTISGQTSEPNGFSDYQEFKSNRPSLKFEFELKQRTGADIFMMGGISNYRLKNIQPKSDIDRVEKEIWGVRVGDSILINSYPYSKIKGYNKIIEIGYYTYFIGEPAKTEKEQRELGIIKPNQQQIAVCCNTGYVILPNGAIRQLRPKLLMELCADNPKLVEQIENADLKVDDVKRMFYFLNKYNATKQ